MKIKNFDDWNIRVRNGARTDPVRRETDQLLGQSASYFHDFGTGVFEKKYFNLLILF